MVQPACWVGMSRLLVIVPAAPATVQRLAFSGDLGAWPGSCTACWHLLQVLPNVGVQNVLPFNHNHGQNQLQKTASHASLGPEGLVGQDRGGLGAQCWFQKRTRSIAGLEQGLEGARESACGPQHAAHPHCPCRRTTGSASSPALASAAAGALTAESACPSLAPPVNPSQVLARHLDASSIACTARQ